MGIGSLYVGGGLLSLVLSLFRFLYTAAAGFGMIALSISLFREHSILWGIVALVIGTPVAIGIANYLFFPMLIFSIVALIVWGIAHLLGSHVGIDNIEHYIWLSIFVAGALLSGYLLIGGIKRKNRSEITEYGIMFAIMGGIVVSIIR